MFLEANATVDLEDYKSQIKELDVLRDALRDAKTSWQDIHKRIMEFRNKHDVTIVRFLTLISSQSFRVYWQELCSIKGSEMHPSYRVGSAGREFLDAVKKFFESEEYSSNEAKCILV